MENALMSELPLNRWRKPGDTAGLAAHLTSAEAAFVNGATAFIDGGMFQQSWSYWRPNF